MGNRNYSIYRDEVKSLRAVINPDVSKIHNIGIMAHIDAGKTTTTERMLYYSDVDDGDTVTDYMAQERERGITIQSAAVTFDWKDHRINLIYTPGTYFERALRVLDGAVAVFDASAGVEAQTMTVWRQAEKHKIPCVFHLTLISPSLSYSIHSIKTKLKANPVLLQMTFLNISFTGLADLITRQKMNTLQPTDDPDVLQADSEVADLNDDFAKLLLGRYSENFDAVPAGELREARNHDLVRWYKDDLCALAFKLVHDKQRGPLMFVRIYSGSMKAQSAVYNINRNGTNALAETRLSNNGEKMLIVISLSHSPALQCIFSLVYAQTILCGMGELHIEIIHDRIKRDHNIETHLGPLQVAYRETILQSATATDTLDHTLGVKRHVVTVELAVHALMKESSTSCDVTFEEEGNTRLPAVVKEAVENGVQSAYLQGPVLGFPVLGVKTVIQHVSLEPGTSAAMVSTSGWGAGFGAGDGSGSDCRGRVSESCACRSRPATRYCMRHPKSTGKQGYSIILRTLTSGNATFSLELSSYEPMNTQDQNILLNKMAGLA
uniref:G elongation factor, mitochondrial 2 n=1 Tax=Sinocyclocheilus grahami TaxID=75366 RepID=A0A672M7L3_SINGR